MNGEIAYYKKKCRELNWEIEQLQAEVEALREVLKQISCLCYEWTKTTPIEIVTAGGALDAAPIPEIHQLANAAIDRAWEVDDDSK